MTEQLVRDWCARRGVEVKAQRWAHRLPVLLVNVNKAPVAHPFLPLLVPGPIRAGPCCTLTPAPPQQGQGHHSQNLMNSRKPLPLQMWQIM
jgi:hypothetical protein